MCWRGLYLLLRVVAGSTCALASFLLELWWLERVAASRRGFIGVVVWLRMTAEQQDDHVKKSDPESTGAGKC